METKADSEGSSFNCKKVVFAASFLLFTQLLICSCSSPEDFIKPVSIPPSEGATSIHSMEQFKELAYNANLTETASQQEVKFVIINAASRSPALYFINSQTYQYHYDFVVKSLRATISLENFNRRAYFNSEKDFLAGEIIFHPNYSRASGQTGIFAMGFWPADPVPKKGVEIAFGLISDSLLIPACSIVYHPKGSIQERLIVEEQYDKSHIPFILTDQLFANMNFIPYNTGESFGILRLTPGTHFSFSDIVLFKTLPGQTGQISGMITEFPQTPLSHVNILAMQNNIPNAFIRSFSLKDEIVKLDNRPVRFIVDDDRYIIEEATLTEVEHHIDSQRPKEVQIPIADTSEDRIRVLSDICFTDNNKYGAKAANVAELKRFLPIGKVPDGFAVPFIHYIRFMNENGLFDTVRQMLADTLFLVDLDYRAEKLRHLQVLIENGHVNSVSESLFQSVLSTYHGGTPLRCRSSANTEDLASFSGAGIHSSFTHHLDEGPLSKSIKQVWASLWNYEAFQARSFYNVDHFKSAMGVLIHPNFKGEKANGVAVTRNIFDPAWRGFYVNVQVGEDLITNPDGESIPEEILISAIGPQQRYEKQYLRYSNQLERGGTVLSQTHIDELVRYMELIQNHFKVQYNALHDDGFAMEIEFKITSENILVIKQARPWID